MRVIIYTLTDPRDNLIKYMGKAQTAYGKIWKYKY